MKTADQHLAHVLFHDEDGDVSTLTTIALQHVISLQQVVLDALYCDAADLGAIKDVLWLANRMTRTTIGVMQARYEQEVKADAAVVATIRQAYKEAVSKENGR